MTTKAKGTDEIEEGFMETDEFQEAIQDLSEEKANIVIAFLTNAVNDAREQGKKDGEIKTREQYISDAERWLIKSPTRYLPIEWLVARLTDDLRIRKKELNK